MNRVGAKIRTSFGGGRRRAILCSILCALLLTLPGCQSGFEPGSLRLPLAHNPQMTGGRTQDGRPLTAASADDDIQKLKNSVVKNGTADHKLAHAILGARVTRLDGAGKPAPRNPGKLKIEVALQKGYWKTEKLEFTSNLSTAVNAGVVGFTKVKATKAPGFQLTAICDDRDCDKATLRLEQNTPAEGKLPTRNDEAAMITRLRDATVGSRAADATAGEFKKSDRLEPLRRAIETGAEVRYETLEVAWGVSRFKLGINGSGIEFCISGLLVETNDGDEPLFTDCDGEKSKHSLRGLLVGNNNKGGLVLNLVEGGAVLVLTVLPVERATAPGGDGGHDVTPATEAPPEPVPALPGSPRIPADPNHPVTRQWEKDRNRSEIASYARRWSKEEGERTQIFLARLQPNLPLLTKTLAAHRVPNEFLTITLMESRFFIDEGYPVEVNRASTATGPWQFLEDTGRWLGLRVKPFQSGRKADPCDERGQLAPSTNAAGKYFRIMLDQFPNDPRLAVMSYYWGNGNVGDAVDCMKNAECIQRRLGAKANGRVDEIKRSGFDFWSVKEFNMAPHAATEYVVRFVSGQFVAREPERYGLKPLDPNALGVKAAPAAACK